MATPQAPPALERSVDVSLPLPKSVPKQSNLTWDEYLASRGKTFTSDDEEDNPVNEADLVLPKVTFGEESFRQLRIMIDEAKQARRGNPRG